MKCLKKVYFLFPLFFGGLMVFILSCANEPVQSVAAVDAQKIFTFEVYPLLESKCFSCHGKDLEELKGELDLRSLAGMLKGGESGKAALVKGQAEKSPIYVAAARLDEETAMPPKETDRLDEAEVNSLKQWIEAGAPWPNEPERKAIIAAGGWDFKGKIPLTTSGGLSDSWTNRKYKIEDVWAFHPLKKVDIPTVKENTSSNPIDAFVQRKLTSYALKPAPKADKRTLIRRATFDLIGLPPSNREINDFLADDAPDAFEKVVERLLASPHYGEQWGRHWLDVVRYADSDGLSNDYARPNAWRYRDYVIRSFNEDKPYNQFVKEQIAGDEMNPNNSELLIATGFLRMGPWEHTFMSIEAETRQFFLDDVSNSVGEVFLSQPLGCARCHDHKFDPIPTKDVYQVQSVFATTQFTDRPAPYLASENLSLLPKEKQRLRDAIAFTKSEQQTISAKEETALRKWFAERGRKYLPKEIWRKLPDRQQPPRHAGLTDEDLGYRKLLGTRMQRFNKEMLAFEPLAYSVYSGPKRKFNSHQRLKLPENLEGALAETYILTGGSVYAKGEKVKPGALSVLASLQSPSKKQKSLAIDIPNSMDKRRLTFAKWLVHPDNPLTTRTIVNRIWQYHFGNGIAENTNNFGVTGRKPTHPELLDWLANNFIENGWSIKQLHRLILLSDAWQRSSEHPDLDKIKIVDSDNKYLAVFTPRRLDAEEIRDAVLSASGVLNLEIGGLPVRPAIHQEVALQPRQVMGSIAPAYQPSSTKAERNRRTIYALKLRGLSNPLLDVFNQPTTDLSCEKRSNSTVSPQVFMLFNDKDIRNRGVALANEIANNFEEENSRIKKVYERIFKRLPAKVEIRQGKKYLEKMTEYHHANESPKEAFPTSVEREMFEEMTGKTFTFSEHLEVYENYEADLKPRDVAPETRALADLALVLFNSNEFMYVY